MRTLVADNFLLLQEFSQYIICRKYNTTDIERVSSMYVIEILIWQFSDYKLLYNYMYIHHTTAASDSFESKRIA